MGLLILVKSLPSSLRRVTSAGNFVSEVDGLRFLAIFPVVIQHLSERFERHVTYRFNGGFEYDSLIFLTNRGFIGVYIFFVISGFILALPFASHKLTNSAKVPLKTYFLRRLSRLEPPYLIAMTGITVSLIILQLYSWKEILPHFAASTVYLHSFIYHSWSYINPPVWTLEIEVQFYILAPFLSYLLFSISKTEIRRIVMVCLIAIVMILQQHTGLLKQWTILTILGHLHFFLIGFIIADIYLIDWKRKAQKHFIFNYSALLALVSLVVVWSWDYNLLSRVMFVLSLFLLIYSSFRATWFNRFICLPWITAVGGMCYTIYLIHLPIIEFMMRLTKSLQVTTEFSINFLLQLLIIGPIILILSIIFYLLIEKPCMYRDWPARLAGRIKNLFSWA